MDWRTSIRSSAAVVLSDSVCCDGFFVDARVRVQTHTHEDHTSKFDSSLGNQQVLALHGTRDLLIAEKNATLDIHSNFRGLRPNEPTPVPGGQVVLIDNGHMLGSAQVLLEHEDGYRTGYSGDFSWPLDEVIQVNELVLDSTYGAPTQVRRFTQEEAEALLVERVLERVKFEPVFIRAYSGTLQRACALLSDVCPFGLIVSTRREKDLLVYQRHGYPIGSVLVAGTPEAAAAMAEGRYVFFEGKGDPSPTNRDFGYNIRLSAMYTSTDEAIVDFTDNSCAIAISNHADFVGTLEFVERSGASRVLTDNIRGSHGVDLAMALRERLGIDAQASESDRSHSRAWGQ
jgi:putative mRNA 3-end processing factor